MFHASTVIFYGNYIYANFNKNNKPTIGYWNIKQWECENIRTRKWQQASTMYRRK